MPQWSTGITYCTTVLEGISWTVPERYEPTEIIGNGTFGAVCRAYDSVTGQQVAIKKLAAPVVNAFQAHHTYREIRILRQIDHENILDIRDLFTPDGGPDTLNNVYMVSSLLDADLHKILQIQRLSEDHVCFIAYQLLCGLKYLHSAGIIHRDLKPNNVGLNADCTLRILDFGMARPVDKRMSAYVSMRWYRAPEIMYNWTCYSQTSDIWSLGCILAEMLLGRPLFNGGDQIKQFWQICTILGGPNEELVNRMASSSARAYVRSFTSQAPKDFAALFPDASEPVRNLLSKMLVWDPDLRPTATEALAHPFFKPYHEPEYEVTSDAIEFPFEQGMYTLPEWKATLWNEIQAFNSGNEE
jgi:p38 MAP kinase